MGGSVVAQTAGQIEALRDCHIELGAEGSQEGMSIGVGEVWVTEHRMLECLEGGLVFFV